MPQGAEAHPKYSWDSQHSVGWVGTLGWHLCQHSINTCSPKSAVLSSGLTLMSQKRLSGVQGCPQEAPSLKHPGYLVLSRQRPLTVGVPAEESGSWEMGSWREVGPPFQEPQVQEVWRLVESCHGALPELRRGTWIWKSCCPNQDFPFRNTVP